MYKTEALVSVVLQSYVQIISVQVLTVYIPIASSKKQWACPSLELFHPELLKLFNGAF